jgi:hypothetical protein
VNDEAADDEKDMQIDLRLFEPFILSRAKDAIKEATQAMAGDVDGGPNKSKKEMMERVDKLEAALKSQKEEMVCMISLILINIFTCFHCAPL